MKLSNDFETCYVRVEDIFEWVTEKYYIFRSTLQEIFPTTLAMFGNGGGVSSYSSREDERLENARKFSKGPYLRDS